MRNTFGGYAGLTGNIDFNSDIDEMENLEANIFMEGKNNKNLVKLLDDCYDVFHTAFLESIQPGGSSSTSTTGGIQSQRDYQMRNSLRIAKEALKANLA